MIINLNTVLLHLFSFTPDFEEKSLVFSFIFQLKDGSHIIVLSTKNGIEKVGLGPKNNIIPFRVGMCINFGINLIFNILDTIIPLH